MKKIIKNTDRKLVLDAETLRRLSEEQLTFVVGGRASGTSGNPTKC